MNEIKTAELTGAALNWAVAKCEGKAFAELGEKFKLAYSPSTDWAQSGPIIERERITVRFWEGEDYVHAYKWNTEGWLEGSTPLIAAMRCYVASKLGDTVEIPAELLTN